MSINSEALSVHDPTGAAASRTGGARSARSWSGRKILGNTMWLGLAHVAGGITQVGRSAIVARHLGPLSYGHWGFAFALVNLFAGAADFGLSTLAVRDLSRQSGSGRYLGTLASIKLALSAVLFAAMVGLARVVCPDSESRTLVYLLGAQMLAYSAMLLLFSFLRGVERMDIESAITVLHNVVALVVVGILAYGGASAVQIAWGYLWSGLAALLLTAITLVCLKLVPRPRFDGSLARSLLRETWPIGIGIISTTLYYFVDRLYMGMLGQDVQIGWYTAAYSATLFAAGIVTVVRSAFMPAQARALERDGGDRSVLHLYGVASLALGLPIAVGGVLLAKPFLQLIYGDGFVEGAAAMRILSLAAAVMFLSSFYGSNLLVAGRQRLYLVGVLFGAVVNIALNVLLIPRFSLEGAAVATVVSEAAVLAVMMWNCRWVLPLKSIVSWLPRPLLATAAMGAATALLESALPGTALLAVAPALYLAMALALKVFQGFVASGSELFRPEPLT